MFMHYVWVVHDLQLPGLSLRTRQGCIPSDGVLMEIPGGTFTADVSDRRTLKIQGVTEGDLPHLAGYPEGEGKRALHSR